MNLDQNPVSPVHTWVWKCIPSNAHLATIQEEKNLILTQETSGDAT